MRSQAGVWGTWIVSLALASALPAHGAELKPQTKATEAGFELIEHALGPVRVVKASGAYLYAGVGQRLQVYASAGSARPKLVHEAPSLDDEVADICIDGTRLYLAGRTAGLVVYDLSNPAHPRRLGALHGVNFRPRSIAVAGGILYAASGTAGIQMVDVSNPSAPHITAVFNEGLSAYQRVLLRAPYLYATDADAGFLVLDASLPATLLRLGSMTLPDNGEQIAVQGDHAYVAAGKAGLRVIALADPRRPVEVGHSVKDTPENAVGLALTGSRLLLADRSLTTGEQHYHSGGLRVIDVADPQQPVQLAERRGDLVAVDAAGDTAFVGTHQAGVASTIDVLDLSAPERPKRLSSTDLPLPEGAAMHARGSDLFIADHAFSRLSLAQPTRPTLATSKLLADVDPKDYSYREFVFGDDLAYVHVGRSNTAVFDLRDVDHPRQLSKIGVFGWPLASAGRFVYMKPYSGPALIYDTQVPEAPMLVGSVPGSDHASLASVAGHFLYVADLSMFQLLVLDISNPAAPVLANQIPIPDLFAMQAVDDLLYLGVGGVNAPRWLRLYSLAQAPTVNLLSELAIDNYARYLAVCQRTAFVSIPASPGGGVSAIDATTPTAPFMAAHHPVDHAFSRTVACLPGGTVAVDVGEGVQVLHYTPPTPPARPLRRLKETPGR